MNDTDPENKTDPSRLEVLGKEMAELTAESEVIDIEFQKLLNKRRDLKKRMTATLSEIEQAHLELRKIWGLRKRGVHTFLTQQISDLINEDPVRTWTRAEVLKDVDSTASSAIIGSTLTRLFRLGKIDRVGRGKYRALRGNGNNGIDSQ